MKLIMENWRGYLLREKQKSSLKGPEDLKNLFKDSKIDTLKVFKNAFREGEALGNFIKSFEHQLPEDAQVIAKLYDYIYAFRRDRILSDYGSNDDKVQQKIYDGEVGDEFFSKAPGYFAKRAWNKIKKQLNALNFTDQDYKLKDIFEFLKTELLKRMKGVEPPTPIIIVKGRNVSYGILVKGGEKAEPRIAKMSMGDRGKNALTGIYPGGNIQMSKADGPCLGSWVVSITTDTTQGWGVMLYDVAIEYASIKANGLTSDRSSVSKYAKPVWDKYLSIRSDVVKQQLDIDDEDAEENDLKKLTPNSKKDDCGQWSSISWAKDDGNTWKEQSLSKVYKKEPTVIKQLWEMGLIHAPELGFDLLEKNAPPDQGWWNSLKSIFFEERGTK